MSNDRSTLGIKEPHPAALEAIQYIRSKPIPELMVWLEALSSAAIEGNRLAEVCAGTLQRLMRHEPVSDRYILGLAWTMIEKEKKK